MALKRPGDRAVLLLARLLQSVDEATHNMLARAVLERSADAQAYIKEARAIIADAKAEIEERKVAL